ncbi:uncharacterized protein LOC143561330 [Bidens hawaiensis]|uniref:uncharacterized protein LOC143561330 n=1 Tax=Bidens hawaiensis TaxID=980011 RepID=UPI004049023C
MTDLRIATSPFHVNGITDPSDHLLNFAAVGGVSGWTLPYWCHMFSLILTGAARGWFEKLPDGQIKNWDDLVAKFSQHFSQQKKHMQDPYEILDVIRRDNESIEDFITRFNDESLNIGGISEDMLRCAFHKNVQSGVLIRCLTGKDGMPKTWDEIMSATKLFARTEKTLGSESPKQTTKVEFKNMRVNRPARCSIWSRLQPSTETSKQPYARTLIGNKNKDRNLGQDNYRWTLLTKTPSEILTTENMNFREPQPLIKITHLNPNKQCMFHNDIGHHMDDCVSLRNEIENEIKSGKLEHLFKNVRLEARKPPTQVNSGPPKKQVKDLNVHMIQGGKLCGYKRQEIGCEEWKSEPVVFPRVKGGPFMKYPLMITALIGHYRSKYVFFDTLNEDDKARLKLIHASVSGFRFEVMHPRGVISFPVIFSDRIHSGTEDVEFWVLPAKSKHDVILGREEIGDFNANPSTAHCALGVPTHRGVALIGLNKHCFMKESSKPSKIPKMVERTEPEKWAMHPKFPE